MTEEKPRASSDNPDNPDSPETVDNDRSYSEEPGMGEDEGGKASERKGVDQDG
ncbi:MAG: hypothetical protein ACRDLP_02635 [Solirubrobacteraceae bacterium]